MQIVFLSMNSTEEVPSVLNDEISDILSRLSSPSKTKPSNIEIIEDVYVHVSNDADIIDGEELAGTVAESIDIIQSNDELPKESAIPYDDETEKYRQMIPYNTADPAKIDQQYSILDLLVVNGICNDETFKIFIAEPELHKERANEILDSLYCLEPAEFDDGETNETIHSPEWIDEINAAPVVYATGDENQLVLLPNADAELLPSSSDAEAMVISPSSSDQLSCIESCKYLVKQNTFFLSNRLENDDLLIDVISISQRHHWHHRTHRRIPTKMLQTHSLRRKSSQFSKRTLRQHKRNLHHSLPLQNQRKNGDQLAIGSYKSMPGRRISVYVNVISVIWNTAFMNQKMSYCI